MNVYTLEILVSLVVVGAVLALWALVAREW